MEEINKEVALFNRKISKVLGDEKKNASSVTPGYLLIAGNTIIDLNPAVIGYTGLKLQELLNKPFTEILGSLSPAFNTIPVIDFINDKVLGNTIRFNIAFRFGNERLSDFEMNITRIGEHQIAFMIPLEASGENDDQTGELENIKSGISDFNVQSTVLFRMSDQRNQCYYFSKQWLGFTGKTLKEELNEGWIHHIHPGDFERVIETINRAFDQQLKYETSYRLIRSDDESRVIHESGIPLYDIDGNFIGYLSVSVDISGLKEKETENENAFN